MKRNIQKRKSNENSSNNNNSDNNTTATGDSDGGTINYDNLLDDDEQEIILQQLIDKTNEYQQVAYTCIRIICYIISIVCFFGSIYIDYKYYNNKNCNYNSLIIQRWFHTIVSILLHIMIPFIIKNVDSLSMIQMIIPIHILILCNILIGMYILLLEQDKPYEYEIYHDNNDDEYFYYYYKCLYHSIKLICSNIIIVLVSIYLRYDILSSYTNIAELQSSKYHYKSI